MKITKAWYFAPEGNRLKYQDNRLIRVGVTHRIEGKPETCSHGLHASNRIIDALKYSQTNILYRVELSGEMDRAEDKIAAQSRKYLQRFDMESILFEFSRKQALINIKKVKLYTRKDDYSLIIEWLKTGDQNIRSAAWSAAESAAWSAAGSAARSAAWSAARSAARSAAESAARSAAESAAWLAARSAARSAAWSAARSAQERMLARMMKAKFWNIA